MRLFKVLANRPIRQLWAGQVFSAVGDEIYGIALVWYATQLMGLEAGFVAATQAGAVFVSSLLGGVWADHRDHQRVMIGTDVIRGLAVLSIPIYALFYPIGLGILIPVAVVISSLSAFFNPALSAFLPRLAEDRVTLQAANGLMETTTRFARIIGPGLVALLSRLIPIVHYFTVEAVSYFISAWSVAKVKPPPEHIETETIRLHPWQSLIIGHRLARSIASINYIMMTGAIVGGAWLFIFPLGMTLMIRERLPMDVGSVGLLVFAYGIGNLSSNLALANFTLNRPERWMHIGRMLGGLGFVFLGLSHTLPQMMAACALAATGGPMTDLGYVNLVQKHFRGRDLARIYRYMMMLSYGALLVGMLVSPTLFKTFSVPSVIIGAASTIFLFGILGFKFGIDPPKTKPKAAAY